MIEIWDEVKVKVKVEVEVKVKFEHIGNFQNLVKYVLNLNLILNLTMSQGFLQSPGSLPLHLPFSFFLLLPLQV